MFTWIYGGFWISLQLFSENRFVLEGFLTSCSFDYISRNIYNRSLNMAMIIGGFCIPVSTIVLFYLLIWNILRSKKCLVPNLVKSKSSFESSHTNKKLIKSSLDISQKKNDFKNGLEKEVKILKTLIMFVGMFCVAWLPYAIVSMLAQYGSNIENYINPYTTSLPALFAKTASIFNPIIYILKNTNCSTYYRNKFNCRRSLQILFRKNTPTVQV